MRVLVAPDKFKGSASAAQAAAAIAAGLRRARPELEVVELPVADGGEGTVAAALAAGYAAVPVTVEGPTGQPVEATFAIGAGTAVVELADAVGLRRLPHGLAPMTASTYGVGQVIRAALDQGANVIVLGLGGSASTDGGAGMMQALGARLTDGRDVELARGGTALAGLAAIDLADLDKRLRAVEFLVASDVDNPLLGPEGAAAVFGPQKGATPADVALLDRALGRWAELTSRADPAGARARPGAASAPQASAPGAGAAGGTGFAALAYLGARLVPGIDLVLKLIDFDAKLARADLVITGEGSLDRQTLAGKAPLGVARAAARRSVPVVVVAGQVLLTPGELAAAGFTAAYSLARSEPDQVRRIAKEAQLLAEAGALIAASPLVASPLAASPPSASA